MKDRTGRIQTANTGTLFLDEIANIPVYLQSKLLNVIQERKVIPLGSNKEMETDIRLICATNRDLKRMVKENLFREDLFYRINTIELEIPALRDRMGDIALLTEYFLEYYSNKYGKSGIKITNDAWNKLISYSWPGNIRELRHHIEKGVILSNNMRITQADLQLFPGEEIKETPHTLVEIERKAIIAAINRHKGSIREAAKELQVSRQTLYNKIEKYDIR